MGKTIDGRITHTHDIEANWEIIGNDFIPHAGEMIVYDTDDTHSEERFKLGDNQTPLNKLKFFKSAHSISEIIGNDTQIILDDDFKYDRLTNTLIVRGDTKHPGTIIADTLTGKATSADKATKD